MVSSDRHSDGELHGHEAFGERVCGGRSSSAMWPLLTKCSPGAAMIIAELARKAGFPDGVFNIIHGAHDAVNFILDEPRIKAISFVGSDKAGNYIYSRGAANGKRVQANLGAKNHAA